MKVETVRFLYITKVSRNPFYNKNVIINDNKKIKEPFKFSESDNVF